MKTRWQEEATERKIVCNRKRYNIMEFSSFDEAIGYLKKGDTVLAFHNLGRYVMRIYMIEYNCITCTDHIDIVCIRRNSPWCNNGLVLVEDY